MTAGMALNRQIFERVVSLVEPSLGLHKKLRIRHSPWFTTP
jgi:hypothetical protein